MSANARPRCPISTASAGCSASHRTAEASARGSSGATTTPPPARLRIRAELPVRRQEHGSTRCHEVGELRRDELLERRVSRKWHQEGVTRCDIPRNVLQRHLGPKEDVVETLTTNLGQERRLDGSVADERECGRPIEQCGCVEDRTKSLCDAVGPGKRHEKAVPGEIQFLARVAACAVEEEIECAVRDESRFRTSAPQGVDVSAERSRHGDNAGGASIQIALDQFGQPEAAAPKSRPRLTAAAGQRSRTSRTKGMP